jgi:hypothetical protein
LLKIRFEEATMKIFKMVLDALFALGGVASLALLAWGGWLVFTHSRRFVAETQNDASDAAGAPTPHAR